MAIPKVVDYPSAKWRKLGLIFIFFVTILYLQSKLGTQTRISEKELTVKKETQNGHEIGDNEYIPGKDLIRQMTSHAWKGYKDFAWGSDELNPVSKTGSNFYGRESLALTIIDSLDTLLIAGLHKEYAEARDFALKISFDKDMHISLFESNIRIVGGFLSAFALTGEGKFVSRAFDLANRYLTSFKDLDFPLRDVELMAHMKPEEKEKKMHEVIILAEAGTLSMELGYLSYIIKDPTLKNHAYKYVQKLASLKSRYKGLLPKLIMTKNEEQDGCKLLILMARFWCWRYE
jgi:mannosyl-oligosaccharide alpha-1,2-mannosidase